MDIVTWVRNQWDRVSAWVIVALGGMALVLGWVGVTGTPYTFEQIPYVISGGLGGIFLLGVGAMLWVSADLRDEWRKLDQLLELHEQQTAGTPNADELATGPSEVDMRIAETNGSDPGEAAAVAAQRLRRSRSAAR